MLAELIKGVLINNSINIEKLLFRSYGLLKQQIQKVIGLYGMKLTPVVNLKFCKRYRLKSLQNTPKNLIPHLKMTILFQKLI